MLGRELVRSFAEHQVDALDIDEIDISQRAATLEILESINPDLIINSAVLVDVDRCEEQPKAAWKVNALGAQNVALAAARCNAALVYISTDYVFDGAATHDYAEHHPVNPINHYGRSKLYGELLSRNLCRKLYVVRSSWLFGHSSTSYVARILRQAKEGGVQMPDDQLEAPTYSCHLAQGLLPLVNSGCYGIYHYSGGEGCTRMAFARAVLEQAGLNTELQLLPADAAAKKRVAARPRRIVLDCTLYRMAIAPLPSWQEGIREYFMKQPYHTRKS